MANPGNDFSESHPEWSFQFILQSGDGKCQVPKSRCDELMDIIIAWAESNELAIGGGYDKYRYDDL